MLAAVGSGALVGLSGCLDALVPNVDEEGDALVAELWIYDQDSDRTEPVADTHQGHWHGNLPAVPRGSVLSLSAAFRDHDRETILLGDDEPYQLQARYNGGTHETISVDSHGDHLQLTGEEVGETEIVFQLAESGETVWEAPPISIDVTPA